MFEKISLDSLTLLKASLKANPDALKGLDNLTIAITLNKKMMDITPTKESESYPEFLSLTPDEYEFLKRCVDLMPWGPAILEFGEFIEAIKFPVEG